MTEPDQKAMSSLRLLSIPFVFSQVPLLTSRQFIDAAKRWDYRLSIDDLEEFNQSGLLVPFFRVDDAPETALVVEPHANDNSQVADYSRKGMLRDPALEDRTAAPHRRPADAPDRWWDGYFYGEWQLLGLKDALNARSNLKVVPEGQADYVDYAKRLRNEHLVVAALSARWFPRIVGQVTFRSGADEDALTSAQYGVDSATRMSQTALDAERLRPAAEFLLSRAHTYDPMREWWELIRHSDHSGWFKMRGGALEAIWQRISAEVLLLAHEEIAESGELEPLPDFTSNPRIWHPLLDRLGAQPHADGLERSLARVGLDPNPRVLLVLEGATEMLHLHALLDEFGIGRSHQVRLDKQDTSSDSPSQLARFVAPRLGRVRARHFDLESTPTALFVAMDAEGTYWRTPALQEKNLRKLQSIVQRQVEAQGGSLTKEELDLLVQVRTWGEHKYELANFTDDELETGFISVGMKLGITATAETHTALRAGIEHARANKLDIEIVFSRLQWEVNKVALAEELLPMLIAKLEYDHEEDHQHPPVIQLAYDLYSLVQRLSHGSFHLQTPTDE